MTETAKDMKELNWKEMSAVSGGLLDEIRKQLLLAMIRLTKAMNVSKEACLAARRRDDFPEEEIAFIDANW